MSYTIPFKTFKTKIRGLNLGDLNYPSSASLPFLKSEGGNSKALFALEVLMHIPKNYSSVLKDFWGEIIYDMKAWAQAAQETSCDILALKFNINDENEIDNALELLKQIVKIAQKPLLITGTNKKNIDAILLPKLAQIPPKDCIIGVVEQENYEKIAPIIAEKNHFVIARTPIDINLAKELNILLSDLGISQDKILIDTNMGALGYGLDYGYSIIERVKNAGLEGDEMLNMPIIAFAGEEAWKTKEARTNDFSSSYGDFAQRAIAWEATTASAIMLAGANVLVLWHPKVIDGLKTAMGDF